MLLEDEIEICLTEHKCDLVAFFQNDQWLSKLYYLSDIFQKLNNLSCNIIPSNDKTNNFVEKINIWKIKVEKDSYKLFFRIGNFVIEKNHRKTFIAKITIGRLKVLETKFHKYITSNIDY